MAEKREHNNRLRWMISAVVLLFVAAAVVPVAAVNENALLKHNDLTIAVQDAVKALHTNVDGTYYYIDGSQVTDAYHFIIGNNLTNGGQNAIHITSDYVNHPEGTVTFSNNPNGSFYVSDTGGRGYEDEAVLLIAVNKSVPSNFNIHLKADGYQILDHPPSESPDSDEVSDYTDTYERDFTAADFLYNQNGVLVSQNWKPGTYGSSGDVNFKLFNSENLNTEPDYNFILADIDLGVIGNSGSLGGNSTYRTSLYYYGNPRVIYNITPDLGTAGRVAFVPYAWVNYTTGGGGYFDKDIGWTSRADSSSWLVNASIN